LGCILALFGRMIYKSYEVTAATEILVNVTGLTAMLVLGVVLDRMKADRPVRRYDGVRFDAGKVVDRA